MIWLFVDFSFPWNPQKIATFMSTNLPICRSFTARLERKLNFAIRLAQKRFNHVNTSICRYAGGCGLVEKNSCGLPHDKLDRKDECGQSTSQQIASSLWALADLRVMGQRTRLFAWLAMLHLALLAFLAACLKFSYAQWRNRDGYYKSATCS